MFGLGQIPGREGAARVSREKVGKGLEKVVKRIGSSFSK